MRKQVYTIQDVKAKECLNLVMLKNTAEAERFFQAVCENPQSPASRYPRDYKVLCLGSVDSETGEITPGLPEDVTPYNWLEVHELNRKGGKNAAST